jgi:hypothetical protein
MEAERASETLVCSSILTRLVAREDSIACLLFYDVLTFFPHICYSARSGSRYLFGFRGKGGNGSIIRRPELLSFQAGNPRWSPIRAGTWPVCVSTVLTVRTEAIQKNTGVSRVCRNRPHDWRNLKRKQSHNTSMEAQR